ncbi:N-methylhydantoinase A/oxoprolinase/acetone carboxylase beta subunit [Kibdelosporangium banguiense]|uniref:N-methylhydantoinase A/oxoprolinase/acetone carboxylase beta subunit n=1 Tax=Kibdelosporangium banguiense TaxID=1365924 RepID=A0ABS4TGH2_9PSEU|nr:hypothetical protein [Kibdelosporangium banguiense]MBP2323533.1 N-methylhydantoinase A/oxoprolinase/acetone carboxylase beta subunit [Kibdelosporangium banguiense]
MTEYSVAVDVGGTFTDVFAWNLDTGEAYRRTQLVAGTSIAGPAVVQQLDATVFVPDGVPASVDGNGNLILRVGVATS